MVGVVGVEGVVPPEPVQGLSGSPGSGLKKPPRSLGRRGRESHRAEISRLTPDKLCRKPYLGKAGQRREEARQAPTRKERTTGTTQDS